MEPYYDGPFQVTEALEKNVYALRTVAGTALKGRYHGDRLFPAYVSDMQPVQSLWYGSKRLLQMDRERYQKQAGFLEPSNDSR